MKPLTATEALDVTLKYRRENNRVLKEAYAAIRISAGLGLREAAVLYSVVSEHTLAQDAATALSEAGYIGGAAGGKLIVQW